MEGKRLLRSAEELRKDAGSARFAQVMEEHRRDAKYWMENFSDSPNDVCGWSHNYVCPTCAGRLIFDREKPKNHFCPACGKDAPNTDFICQSWTNSRRNDLSGAIESAALLAVIDGDKAAERFVIDTLMWYAENYINFPEHGLYAGRGRVMGQSLTEASWAVRLMRALNTMGFDGSSAEGQKLHRYLFLPIARLVQAQSQMIHNIPLWQMTCAVGAGLTFNDERLVMQGMGGVLGAINQVLQGFTPDGMWFENATGYHFYSLEAATQLCIFLREAGHDGRVPEVFERVMNAYLAPAPLLLRDGSLPATNDSTGDNELYKKAGIYLRAAKLFADMPRAAELAAVAAALYARAGDRAIEGEFLYGVPQAEPNMPVYGSVHLSHNRIAALRSPRMEIITKYGNLTSSHAHPDALELMIPPFAVDLGTAGYGSDLHKQWYTKTTAHATFAIDGQSHSRVAKGEGEMSADGLSFTATVADAYPGVSATRSFKLDGATLFDELTVTCEAAHQIDWFFHARGEFSAEGGSSPCEVPEGIESSQWLTNAQACAAPYRFSWKYQDQTLSLDLEPSSPSAKVWFVTSPDNPGHLRRVGIVARVNGVSASFKAKFSVR